jgi:ketosteroid isomerase-like protein
MSEHDVEVVRRIYAGAASRDHTSVLALYDPEIEWDTSRPGTPGDMAGSAVYRGHEGLRTWFRAWYEAWYDLVDECQELIDAGEHVVWVSTMRGRGRISGAEVSSRSYAGVWTVRGEKVVGVVSFPTREEALEFVGFTE